MEDLEGDMDKNDENSEFELSKIKPDGPPVSKRDVPKRTCIKKATYKEEDSDQEDSKTGYPEISSHEIKNPETEVDSKPETEVESKTETDVISEPDTCQEEDNDDQNPKQLKKVDGAATKLQKKMKKLMEIVIQYKDQDGSDRVLSDPFMKLPTRKELPDYYDVIKKPVDITKILTKIEDGKYDNMDVMEKDFMLLCQNTQKYNQDGSLIHEDSIVLQSVFNSAREKLSLEWNDINPDLDEESSHESTEDAAKEEE